MTGSDKENLFFIGLLVFLATFLTCSGYSTGHTVGRGREACVWTWASAQTEVDSLRIEKVCPR